MSFPLPNEKCGCLIVKAKAGVIFSIEFGETEFKKIGDGEMNTAPGNAEKN